MFWKRLFATKSLEMLQAEAAGENRLRRILGPIALTSLGVGAIIGAGIFVMTGEVAANAAGPGIVLSFVIAAICCGLAAFCYAEFASMAPVAGSAYTYAYATLGELLAWIIGWDLILEYAMSAATVAASWTKYFNKFLEVCFGCKILDQFCNDPFSVPGAYGNLPAVGILLVCIVVLVIGIRESAASNIVLVVVKIGVVLFVIAVGYRYVDSWRWTSLPVEGRKLPEQQILPDMARDYAQTEADLLQAGEKWLKHFSAQELLHVETRTPEHVFWILSKHAYPLTDQGALDVDQRAKEIEDMALAAFLIGNARASGDLLLIYQMETRHKKKLPASDRDWEIVSSLLAKAKKEAPQKMTEKWGLLGHLGLNQQLARLDDATRSSFMPYGLSGIMFGAALVFFAFLGFDAVSTHAEEAIQPQRDVPIGILGSLFICTLLYLGVSAVITGMVPYPDIDTEAAVASAFADRPEASGSFWLRASSGLIAAGALAGMTSVLLITFLSQARIFLAMARDGLLPRSVFGAIHERFRTPHISTMVTGGLMCVVAAFTPIRALEEMVNIGTFFAFVVVCAAVLILRIQRPDAPRPFRCPVVYFVAPLGILVNLLLMLFLRSETWFRLVAWLAIGLLIYFSFGWRHSVLGSQAKSQ